MLASSGPTMFPAHVPRAAENPLSANARSQVGNVKEKEKKRKEKTATLRPVRLARDPSCRTDRCGPLCGLGNINAQLVIIPNMNYYYFII